MNNDGNKSISFAMMTDEHLRLIEKTFFFAFAALIA